MFLWWHSMHQQKHCPSYQCLPGHLLLYHHCRVTVGPAFPLQNMTMKGQSDTAVIYWDDLQLLQPISCSGQFNGPVLLPFKLALSHPVLGQFEHRIQIFLKLLESQEGVIRSDTSCISGTIKIWNYLWAWSSQTGKIICVLHRSGCFIPF